MAALYLAGEAALPRGSASSPSPPKGLNSAQLQQRSFLAVWSAGLFANDTQHREPSVSRSCCLVERREAEHRPQDRSLTSAQPLSEPLS